MGQGEHGRLVAVEAPTARKRKQVIEKYLDELKKPPLMTLTLINSCCVGKYSTKSHIVIW